MFTALFINTDKTAMGLIVALGLVLSACGDNIHEYAPVAMLKEVDRQMAPEFVKGNWRYRGARAVDEGIAVYIQIPERLDISDDQHKDYLIKTICPKLDNLEFWRKVIGYRLFIRTYNYVDRNYTQALCPKPFNI
ncbi:hypothetical protein N7931_03120 [Catenovulum sp. 2E275]|uniref:hypothetical protein n=1 Tax=Catenovulum sp. 2E275 TaxID=2980497 RepID=UPI0021CE697D|nr:hypothetical protein [Catenovulum sp. 2E275]MCU4674615.1 hypothetical protein [Catenovulum sp. 2E275]